VRAFPIHVGDFSGGVDTTMNVFPSWQPPSRAFALACSLATVLVAAGCGHKQRPTPTAPTVQTSIAQFGSIQPSASLAGIIAPYENVAIQSTLSEPTDTVNVQEGDTVSKGEVLAQLDTADLQAQLAADLASTTHAVYQGSLTISQGVDTLHAAQAAITRDQADLARYEALYAKGYVSQQQLATEEATVRNDQSALESAQSNVQANGTMSSSGLQQSTVAQAQAQAQQIRVSIAKATIVSPIDGVVVNRNLNPGEYPGTREIFTLQQVDPIYAVLHGSDEQVANIQPGSRVTIATGNLGEGTFTGSVIGVLNQVVPGSTDFEVKVILQNPQRKLRPGTAVQGTVALPAVRGIRIPTSAYTDDNHDAVMAVAADGTVKTTKVSELSTDGTTAIVTGIPAGTRIVTDGQVSVGDGQKIEF